MLLGASAWLVSRIFGLPKARRFARPNGLRSGATVFRWQQSASSGPFARTSSTSNGGDVDGEVVETTWVREGSTNPKDLIE